MADHGSVGEWVRAQCLLSFGCSWYWDIVLRGICCSLLPCMLRGVGCALSSLQHALSDRAAASDSPCSLLQTLPNNTECLVARQKPCLVHFYKHIMIVLLCLFYLFFRGGGVPYIFMYLFIYLFIYVYLCYTYIYIYMCVIYYIYNVCLLHGHSVRRPRRRASLQISTEAQEHAAQGCTLDKSTTPLPPPNLRYFKSPGQGPLPT